MNTLSHLVVGLWRLSDWDYDTETLADFIHACIDLGVTSFDHADIYGDYACEEMFGLALARDPGLRDQIQLVTKCDIRLVSNQHPENSINHYDTSKAHILASVDHSLAKLHTDRIDLLLLHRPDPLMDADETADALNTLKASGKVLSLGVSNFTVGQFDLLASRLSFPLVTNQIEFSVMNMTALEDGTLDQCQKLRIAPMAWSPLGGGALFHSQSEAAIRLRKTLQEIGHMLEADMDQVALAWLLKHPAHIIPVLGTGKIERVKQAVQALTLDLSREQWFAIWVSAHGHGVP
jgi:predicted oxidoreductase